MMFRWPWQRRQEAESETEKAKTDYEWAVQNRTTVSGVVARIVYRGERNEIIENLHSVAKGHR